MEHRKSSNTQSEELASLAAELSSLRLQAGNPSLRGLAEMAGRVASHTTISDVLHGRAVPRWEVVERLVEALGGDTERFHQLWMNTAVKKPRALTEEEGRDAEYLEHYRKYMLRTYGTHTLASPAPRSETSLSSIYVTPTIVDQSKEESEEISQTDFERRIAKTLLLGGPGSGKSTLCQHLAYSHAQHGDAEVFLLPCRDIVSPLGRTALVTELIDRMLEMALQKSPPQGLVERLLRKGSPMVIFDGLDEIASPEEVGRLVDTANAFAVQYPSVRILITSRPTQVNLRDHVLRDFSRFALEEFSGQQIADFVHKWFASVAGDTEHGDRGVLQQVLSTSWVESNPQNLARICALATASTEAGGALRRPREISKIGHALEKEFSGLIDMAETGGSVSDAGFLSRALSALVVRRWLDCESSMAADHVIDGAGDNGIDAIAVAVERKEILIVQSKWSNTGQAGFDLVDILKVRRGIQLLVSLDYQKFNAKIQRHVAKIDAVLSDPRCKIRLILATPSLRRLDIGSIDGLGSMNEEFNFIDEFLAIEAWDARRIWQATQEVDTSPLQVQAPLGRWIHVDGPFDSYQGVMSVAGVAEWYEAHRNSLFSLNIRTSLGHTHTHNIIETLTNHPDEFWYFNNGITVICESVIPERMRGISSGVVSLTLNDARVVNGAQTVLAIYAAMQKAPDVVSAAYVSVRIVTLENSPSGFGRKIARATNSQDAVRPVDFLSRDLTQLEIRGEFERLLGRKYALESDANVPAPAEGCTAVQAALALACARSTSDVIARVQANRDLLWQTGPKGAYTTLFEQDSPSVMRIWRSVQILLRVQELLEEIRAHLHGSARVIAESAELLIVHIVMRQQNMDAIDDPDADWGPIIDKAATIVPIALELIISHFESRSDSMAAVEKSLKKASSCEFLASLVLSSIAN
ncbi:AIPR family protein [Nocardiopsis sp. SBT366]|uniref:AIPR family protein n=1 Tax=Nocardiopsis sp. SBT366 TaxID=1580529 RepID=UPI0009E4C00B|nr:AIPR family protein [Nocardiopsis sp. SBT366]